MVSISNDSTFVIFQEDKTQTDWGAWTPRIQSTATLDGGSVIANYGMAQSDREFRIIFEASEETVREVEVIIESGAMLYLSCAEGYFSGMITRFDPKYGAATVTFRVNERLA